MTLDEAKKAVLRVGNGRGFIVEGEPVEGHGNNRLVVTGAHCLPTFPPRMTFSHLEERTYGNLLGPLGEEPSVWAECLFADPIGDVAVLGPPEGQALPDEHDAYEGLVENMPALTIADAPSGSAARVLSLKGDWLPCMVEHFGGPWSIKGVSIDAGMSGSPLLTETGLVIGIACTNSSGPNPRLIRGLPGWLSRAVKPTSGMSR